MGKGSKRRPMRISAEEYAKRWNGAFGKKEPELTEDHLQVQHRAAKRNGNLYQALIRARSVLKGTNVSSMTKVACALRVINDAIDGEKNEK